MSQYCLATITNTKYLFFVAQNVVECSLQRCGADKSVSDSHSKRPPQKFQYLKYRWQDRKLFSTSSAVPSITHVTVLCIINKKKKI